MLPSFVVTTVVKTVVKVRKELFEVLIMLSSGVGVASAWQTQEKSINSVDCSQLFSQPPRQARNLSCVQKNGKLSSKSTKMTFYSLQFASLPDELMPVLFDKISSSKFAEYSISTVSSL